MQENSAASAVLAMRASIPVESPGGDPHGSAPRSERVAPREGLGSEGGSNSAISAAHALCVMFHVVRVTAGHFRDSVRCARTMFIPVRFLTAIQRRRSWIHASWFAACVRFLKRGKSLQPISRLVARRLLLHWLTEAVKTFGLGKKSSARQF